MVRIIAQVLAGLMLLFGAATLIPKAYLEYRGRNIQKSILYFFLGFCSLFFSIMAFVYAYLILSREIFT